MSPLLAIKNYDYTVFSEKNKLNNISFINNLMLHLNYFSLTRLLWVESKPPFL